MKKTIGILNAIILALILCLNTKAEELSEIPEEVQVLCFEVGEEFNICPMLLMSLIYTESRGIVTDNLTQITNTKWFKEGMDYCEVDEVKTPINNIRVCAYYLTKWAEEQGEDDIYLVIDSWRYGPENARAMYKPDRPSRYAKVIVDRSAEWEEDFYKKKTEE